MCYFRFSIFVSLNLTIVALCLPSVATATIVPSTTLPTHRERVDNGFRLVWENLEQGDTIDIDTPRLINQLTEKRAQFSMLESEAGFQQLSVIAPYKFPLILEVEDQAFTFNAEDNGSSSSLQIDFVALLGHGVSSFAITAFSKIDIDLTDILSPTPLLELDGPYISISAYFPVTLFFNDDANTSFQVDVTDWLPIIAIPEPSSGLLIACALAGLGIRRKR